MKCTPFTGQTSKGGIFVKYDFTYKVNAVEKYRSGEWVETPEGINQQ